MRVRWRNKLQVYVTHTYSVNAHAVYGRVVGSIRGVRKYSITIFPKLEYQNNILKHLKTIF